MGGGTARAIGGFLDSVSGGGGQTRGVSMEVGEEAAIDLVMAVEYGRPIPRLTEAVRRNSRYNAGARLIERLSEADSR